MNKVKNIGQSFIICMAMYSIIPMPTIDWEEKNMKYIMCFFPLIGGIIGACAMGIYGILSGFTTTFQAVAMLLIPIIISGGIHIDGFIDTCDAYFSYGDKGKKLEILKDPRTGAFGVIGVLVYGLGLLAVYTQILANENPYLMVLPVVFILSRSVGALCMIIMPNARVDGLGASFSNASSQKVVCAVLSVWVMASVVVLWMLQMYICIIFVVIIFVFLLCILPIYSRKFGGITGDLTGCIISLLELLLPLGMAIGGVIL